MTSNHRSNKLREPPKDKRFFKKTCLSYSSRWKAMMKRKEKNYIKRIKDELQPTSHQTLWNPEDNGVTLLKHSMKQRNLLTQNSIPTKNMFQKWRWNKDFLIRMKAKRIHNQEICARRNVKGNSSDKNNYNRYKVAYTWNEKLRDCYNKGKWKDIFFNFNSSKKLLSTAKSAMCCVLIAPVKVKHPTTQHKIRQREKS